MLLSVVSVVSRVTGHRYLASAFMMDYTVEQVFDLTRIDRWFLSKLKNVSDMSKNLKPSIKLASLTEVDFRLLKGRGFSDAQIAAGIGDTEQNVRQHRKVSK